MRLKLFLHPNGARPLLPFNYQYYLSAAIYKIIAKASPEYSNFLHDKGYPAPSGRFMKLFTFSKIQIPHSHRVRGGLTTNEKLPWILYISSPMLEEFVQNFVIGLFEHSGISLCINNHYLQFSVVQVESVATPKFGKRIYCKTLSPTVVSTVRDIKDRRQTHYYRPEEHGLSNAIQQNLREKLGIINTEIAEQKTITFQPDLDYVEKRKMRGKRVTKKITIKPGTAEATEIICFEIPFWLEGDSELMQTAWECGIGEHTAQGFGMMEVVGDMKSKK